MSIFDWLSVTAYYAVIVSAAMIWRWRAERKSRQEWKKYLRAWDEFLKAEQANHQPEAHE